MRNENPLNSIIINTPEKIMDIDAPRKVEYQKEQAVTIVLNRESVPTTSNQQPSQAIHIANAYLTSGYEKLSFDISIPSSVLIDISSIPSIQIQISLPPPLVTCLQQSKNSIIDFGNKFTFNVNLQAVKLN